MKVWAFALCDLRPSYMAAIYLTLLLGVPLGYVVSPSLYSCICRCCSSNLIYDDCMYCCSLLIYCPYLCSPLLFLLLSVHFFLIQICLLQNRMVVCKCISMLCLPLYLLTTQEKTQYKSCEVPRDYPVMSFLASVFIVFSFFLQVGF